MIGAPGEWHKVGLTPQPIKEKSGDHVKDKVIESVEVERAPIKDQAQCSYKQRDLGSSERHIRSIQDR
jgi:hypothetical protein